MAAVAAGAGILRVVGALPAVCLDEALDGMSAGDAKTFSSTLAGGDNEGEDVDVEVSVIGVKEQQLPDLDDDFAQMVVMPVPHRDAEALRSQLFSESRIEIPVTQHGGRTFVRLSVQGYNSEADIERLLAAPALAG